jgi:hypothetical protein
MKMRRAEFLAAVAIVASAGVLQIRAHMQPHPARAVSAPAAQAAPSSCGPARRGIMPASCEPTRDEHPAQRAPLPQHGAEPIWV